MAGDTASASDDAVNKTRDCTFRDTRRKMATVAIKTGPDDRVASVWRRMKGTVLVPAFSRTASKG